MDDVFVVFLLWVINNILILYSFAMSHSDYSFSKYAKFSKNLTFLTPWYAHLHLRIREERNVSFSENFGYVLNEWSHTCTWIFTLKLPKWNWSRCSEQARYLCTINVGDCKRHWCHNLLVRKGTLKHLA